MVQEMDETLTFAVEGGKPLTARAIELEWDEEVGAPSLLLRLPWDDYQRVEEERLFHLEPWARDPVGLLEPGKEVELRLRLADELAGDIGEDLDSAEEAIAYLKERPKGDELWQADNWFALTATQEMELPPDLEGSGRSGYRTSWADMEELSLEMEGGPLFQRVTSHLLDEEIIFEQLEGRLSLLVPYSGDNGEWNCLVDVREEMEQVVVYSLFPDSTPDEQQDEMMVFLTRANYGLVMGNFELDLEDGEVRFKTSIDVEGAELTAALFGSLLNSNVFTMDLYFPSLAAVMSGELSAEEAIARVEG